MREITERFALVSPPPRLRFENKAHSAPSPSTNRDSEIASDRDLD